MIAKREISQKKRVENDTTRAMRAICILAEYGRSNRSVRGDESVTIRAAKFELLYFTQHYLLRITKGKPAVDFLLSNDVTIEGWAIHGEYYPSLKAISISLEAAKNSTSAQITPDGEIRYLIERIYNWLDKRQQESRIALALALDSSK